MKSSDTSTAESGSEVEEIASPKVTRSYLLPKLTPVSEEVCINMLLDESFELSFSLRFGAVA